MTTLAQWQAMTDQQRWDYCRLLEDTVDALELDGDGLPLPVIQGVSLTPEQLDALNKQAFGHTVISTVPPAAPTIRLATAEERDMYERSIKDAPEYPARFEPPIPHMPLKEEYRVAPELAFALQQRQITDATSPHYRRQFMPEE